MTTHDIPMVHTTNVWVNGNPHKVVEINSIAYMLKIMNPIPVLNPSVAKNAAQARVVFGD